MTGTDLDPWTAKEYGVGAGTLIRRVTPKSPAEQSGLQVQDVVTAIEDRPIATLNELMMLVRRHEPGDRVELTVVRSGVKHNLKVRLAEPPDGRLASLNKRSQPLVFPDGSAAVRFRIRCGGRS